MQKLARLAIQRRWLVIGAWLAFIVLAQGISGALGGANYKDTFSLPHTETASVAKVLKNAGLDSQNGATGTVVLKAKTGDVAVGAGGARSPRSPSCARRATRSARSALRGSRSTAPRRGATTAGDPKLLNTAKGSTTGLVNITWTVEPLRPEAVHERLQRAEEAAQRRPAGRVHRQRVPEHRPEQRGCAAVRLRLPRRADHPAASSSAPSRATALPLASAVAALGGGLGLIGMLSHVMNVSNITPQLTELMVHRRRASTTRCSSSPGTAATCAAA